MLAVTSCLVLRVKWISMYLLGSNWAPCFSFHSSLLVRIVCSRSTLFCAVCPLMPYAMSSMNPSARSGALGISRSSALYSMNRIGESGDPCGIPASMFISADVAPLNRNPVVLPVRKLCTSLTICGGMCLCFMLWISLLWWTLLKAPATSMKMTVNISRCFHALYMFSDSTIIVSSVVCCGRAPKVVCRQQVMCFDEIAQQLCGYAFQDFTDCAFKSDRPVCIWFGII